MVNLSSFAKTFESYFSYSTTRSVIIRSLKVGIVYRLAQLFLLLYIVGWELIYNKSYQTFETVTSSVRVRVKGDGLVSVNQTNAQRNNNPDYFKNLFQINPNDSYRVVDPETKKTNTCDDIAVLPNNFNRTLYSWCPNEEIIYDEKIIKNVLNFTVFIRNNVEFKKFNKKLRNLRNHLTDKFITECANYEIQDPSCPVFTIDYILSQAEKNETERYLMLYHGTAIEAQIIWNCNFDFMTEHTCNPVYSFNRINVPFKETVLSNGFSIIYANFFQLNSNDQRVFYKAYGLRIIVNVNGLGGKFSILMFMQSIGVGFGLMSLSYIIADCAMLHFTKKKKIYRKIKEFSIDKKNHQFLARNHCNPNIHKKELNEDKKKVELHRF